MSAGPRTRAPAPPANSFWHVPRAPVHDRVQFVVDRARNRRVIDLGFVDDVRMAGQLEQRGWLHEQIAGVAVETVGIDLDSAGVAAAVELGFTAHVADCESRESLAALGLEPAEVVIAAELIEHLDRPGDFLDAIPILLAPGGELLITTPNPLALTNALLGLIHREVQNAEHVGWHSQRTLVTLLARHGWAVRELAFYRHPHYVAAARADRGERLRVGTFNLYQAAARPLFAVSPSLADGLIAVAVRTGGA